MARVELLSPAGDMDCFKAAMAAGADAVYLGLDKFGARAYAANFSSGELKEAVNTAHILGRKVYLTVNTLFKDDELEMLSESLYEPYIYGLDAVIVQDIGAMSMIHRDFPALPIHVSTQAAVTTADAVKFFQKLGIKRVVPARELSLPELKEIKDETKVELECFIHGSMCYSYSGRCLLSSFIGGRSGNRGRCAQPCRLMYDGAYPLSLKDMCTLDLIPDLIGCGIDSFKIEGRMKNSAYVYAVTSIYRKYIDLFYEKGDIKVSKEDRTELLSLYTRGGNCDGYYKRHNGSEMITSGSGSYNSDKDARNDMQKKYDIPKRAVNIVCDIKKDENVSITVYDRDITVCTETDIIPEGAQNHPLTCDEAALQLKKSGGSGYLIKDLQVNTDEGLFLAKSALNSVRRAGLESFAKKVLASFYRDEPKRASNVPTDLQVTGTCQDHSCEIRAGVLEKSQFEAVCKSGADAVIIPLSSFDSIVSGVNFSDKKLYVSMPYIVRQESRSNSKKEIIKAIKRISEKYDLSGIYISGAESLQILSDIGYSGNIIGDIHLYAYNRSSYETLTRFGITRTSVPTELNERELKKRGITGEDLMIYGRIPVMLSANCIYNTKYGCRTANGGHCLYIKDRKGENLFVHCNCSECINTVYNSHLLDIADENTLFDTIRPSSVRLMFTDEDYDETARILSEYTSNRNKNGSAPLKLTDRFTRGHIRRGID